MPSAASASSRSDRQQTSRQPTSAVSSSTSGKNGGGGITSGQEPLNLPKYYLPYQSRGKETCPYLSRPSSIPNRNDISSTHHTMRVGLGTPVNNLRATAIINSKRDVKIGIPMRKIIPKSFVKNSKVETESISQVTSKIKGLKIYVDPENNNDDASSERPPRESVWERTFKSTEQKANLLAQGHKVSFKVRGDVFSVQKDLRTGKEVVVFEKLTSRKNVPDYCKPNYSKDNGGDGDSKDAAGKRNKVEDIISEGEMKAIPNLMKHFRGILGWQMSLSIKWNLVEERVKLWPNKVPLMPLEEAAEILKISVEDFKSLRIVPDLNEIFLTLKSNLCHSAYPNLAKVMSLSELQKGNRIGAAKYAAESIGMFLHSEIVDKHLGYIRRGEELIQESPQGEPERLRTAVFLQQVQDTLEFTKNFYEEHGDTAFINKISSINSDWNIIQLTTANDSVNLFSNDFLSKRQVPQILLSAFCCVPGQKSRSIFTSSCMQPNIEPGSRMRNGLMEEFQVLLDKNLAISDETTVISRREYWAERARHNETMEGIIQAMEDWVKPWSFLFPGRIKDEKIRKTIQKEILGHPLLKKSSEIQKLLMYRLVENYHFIPQRLQLVMSSFIAKLLEVREEDISDLKFTIENVVKNISTDAPRHPTVLILDNQELDILPWDWIPCLRTTDVTRMPSLNLINSTGNLLNTLQRPCPVSINPNQCTFILNPDGSLPNVQKRLESYLTERKKWTPIVGRSPTTQEMQEVLEQKDILVYCGHGHGSQFYPEYALQKLVCKAVPLLMGCSSAQSHFTGPRLYSSSIVNTYFIAGCAGFVGFLWEVTDTECDRLTVDLLERWVPHPLAKPPVMPFFDNDAQRDREESLLTAVRKSRTAATQFLTKSAAVCYGLPVVNKR